jgi:hypothetical protein
MVMVGILSRKKKTLDEFNLKVDDLEQQQLLLVAEADEQREERFAALRKARLQDRAKHPELFPPTQHWWDRGDNTTHCCYFPHDWRQTQEEIDFYRQVADNYKEGIVYRFHNYDQFLAYYHYTMDEIDRWRDFVELGHVHASDEDLEQWKSHDTDEHHLHEEGWYPLPEPPIYYESWGDLFKMQAAHMRDISNKIRRRKK